MKPHTATTKTTLVEALKKKRILTIKELCEIADRSAMAVIEKYDLRRKKGR